jgi:uncharacterized membrane protein
MLLVAVAVWWTFAVIVWITIMQDCGRDIKDWMLAIGLAVFWPVAAVAIVPVLVYQSVVAGTARIRADLKNRGVLKEFETWLREHKKSE